MKMKGKGNLSYHEETHMFVCFLSLIKVLLEFFFLLSLLIYDIIIEAPLQLDQKRAEHLKNLRIPSQSKRIYHTQWYPKLLQ